MFNKQAQEMFYKKAKNPDDLPWHRNSPDSFLDEAIKTRKEPGRALDIGCGSGVFSIFMAKNGFEVTGLDFVPRALELAEKRAHEESVKVNWVQSDLFSWMSPVKYDIVLDSGCLHSLIGGNLKKYKSRLLEWLNPNGDYILAHWGRKHFLDWRPIGPKRRYRTELVSAFSPELQELRYKQELMTGIPFPFGPTVIGQCIWFRCSRNSAIIPHK